MSKMNVIVPNYKKVLGIATKFAEHWAVYGFQPTRVSCERFLQVFGHVTKKQEKSLQERWDWMQKLPLPKGVKGKPKPFGWQAMAHCYRWGQQLGIEGCSKVTTVLITRKAGKTAFASSLGVATLKFSQNASPGVYCVATTEKQAKLLLRDARSMLTAMARETGEKAKWDGFVARKGQIEYEHNNGFWQALPADERTLDGLQYELVVIDEAALVRDEVYNVIRSAMSSSVGGQHILAISTAGYNYDNWFSRLIFEAIDCLEAGKPIGVNVLAWAVPEESPERKVEFTPEQVGDPEVWKKTHPTLGYTITLKDIQEQYDGAKLSLTELSEFRRTRLNQYTARDVTSMCSKTLTSTVSNSKNDDLVEKALHTYPCYIGFDISFKSDPTAVAISCMDENRVGYTKTQNFIPRQSYDIKTEWSRTKILRSFVDQGLLTIAGGEQIDFQVLELYIRELLTNYNVQAVYTDRATWGISFKDILWDDLGIPVCDYGPSPHLKSIGKQFFLDLLYNSQLYACGNQMLRWELDNCSVTELPDGRRDIQRLETYGSRRALSIDGVYAIIHSLYPYAIHTGTPATSYPETQAEWEKMKESYFV